MWEVGMVLFVTRAFAKNLGNKKTLLRKPFRAHTRTARTAAELPPEQLLSTCGSSGTDPAACRATTPANSASPPARSFSSISNVQFARDRTSSNSSPGGILALSSKASDTAFANPREVAKASTVHLLSCPV